MTDPSRQSPIAVQEIPVPSAGALCETQDLPENGYPAELLLLADRIAFLEETIGSLRRELITRLDIVLRQHEVAARQEATIARLEQLLRLALTRTPGCYEVLKQLTPRSPAS